MKQKNCCKNIRKDTMFKIIYKRKNSGLFIKGNILCFFFFYCTIIKITHFSTLNIALFYENCCKHKAVDKRKLEGIGRFTLEMLRRIAQNHPHQPFSLTALMTRILSFLKNAGCRRPPARHPFLFYIWFEWRIPVY